jgi:hypothetical protein
MYRQYLKTYLTRSEQIEKNNKALPTERYCNFLCQSYLPVESFRSERTNVCIKCSNQFSLAKKYFELGKITEEQFKEDPSIVYKKFETPVLDKELQCVECKIVKKVNEFDHNRNQCKECRNKIANARTNKDLDNNINEIENLKEDIDKLTFYIRRLSVNKIIKILQHYKLGRNSKDKKTDMIANIIQYFKKLQNPYKCLGSCGFMLEKQYSFCKECELRGEKNTIEEKNLKFKENLPTFMENLYELSDIDIIPLNRYSMEAISEFLDIKTNKNLNKNQLKDLINEKLKTKKEEHEKMNNRNLEAPVPLELNGISILARPEDGYINATAMCKAGKKLFANWYQLESTKELIKELETQITKSDIGIPISQLVDVKKGNTSQFSQGSWIHPDLAVQLAQWISPTFALQVSRWVRELAHTGSVIVGQEKTQQQLFELQNENKNLKDNIKKIKRKREYHKLKKGPCFYIVNSDKGYKVGIDMVDINERLRTYRTYNPETKLQYLVYSECSSIIENVIKKKFENFLLEANHEVVIDIDLKQLINSVNTLINFGNFQHTLEDKDEIDRYNIS